MIIQQIDDILLCKDDNEACPFPDHSARRFSM